MLDISQARRLTSIANKRIRQEEELEYEVMSEWEQRAIDFMSDPALHDIIMEFIDSSIKYAADQGRSQASVWLDTHTENSLEIMGESREEPLYNALSASPTIWQQEIDELVLTYDFMDVADRETIYSLVFTTLMDIIVPIYSEQYSIDVYEGQVRTGVYFLW